MKALRLAAGRGTRLGPLTANQPKPMIPIGGVPMIERIMTAIAAHTPVREFVLITGYKAEILQGYLGDGSRWGWKIEYVPQPVPRGVGDAVNTAAPALSDAPFLMTYGDIMLDPVNYRRFADEYAQNGTSGRHHRPHRRRPPHQRHRPGRQMARCRHPRRLRRHQRRVWRGINSINVAVYNHFHQMINRLHDFLRGYYDYL